MRFRWLIACVFLLPAVHSGAQSHDFSFRDNFAWEVKQIDEFIERFNDTGESYIRTYVKNKPGDVLTRERLIKSLFDASRKDWNFDEVTHFLSDVLSPEDPKYLDFNNGLWYANVKCQVQYKGKPAKLSLRMRVENGSGNTCKWVIENAQAPWLKGIDAQQAVAPAQPANGGSHFLHPMSHITNFMNIDEITGDPRYLMDYICSECHHDDSLNTFISECKNKNIVILSSEAVTYDFFQIKGWEIQITQMERAGGNSGWLISKLVRLPL